MVASRIHAGEESKEPEIIGFPGDFQKPRTYCLKIGLEVIQYPHPLIDQTAATPGQSFENVVFLRCVVYLLENVLGYRQMIAKLEEFQTFPCVDLVGFRGAGEDLLEPCKLQVVDVEEAIVASPNERVQRTRVSVEALHCYGNGTTKLSLLLLDTRKEVPEPFRFNPSGSWAIENSSRISPLDRPIATL